MIFLAPTADCACAKLCGQRESSASLNRPGGNITGATVFSYDMESKRLGLLHEAAPAAKTIAALFNPANPAV